MAGRDPDGVDLRGLAASPGTYTGTVRVVRTEAEFDALGPGEILVCPTTSPAWTPLFEIAGALVTDHGGPLSHAAIVAREYALPAVVGTGDATARLTTGDRATVDGSTGLVRVGPGPAEARDDGRR